MTEGALSSVPELAGVLIRWRERSAGSWSDVRGELGNRGGEGPWKQMALMDDCRWGDEEPWNQEQEGEQRGRNEELRVREKG